MKPYQPLRKITRHPGESEEVFQWAKRAREWIDINGRIAYLEGYIESLEWHLTTLQKSCDRLMERVDRLEARR